MGQQERITESAGTAKGKDLNQTFNQLFDLPAPPPEPVYDSHHAKLKAETPVEKKSIEQVSREITASQFDKQAANALDRGDINEATKLFDEAYKSWGAVGVRQMAGHVQHLEKQGTGLDLKVDMGEPKSGEKLIDNFQIVEARSPVGAWFADKLGMADNVKEHTALNGVIDRANDTWKQQSDQLRTSDASKDADYFANRFKNSKNKSAVTDELAGSLNRHIDDSEYQRETSIYEVLRGDKTGQYNEAVLAELSKRLPEKEFGMHMPQQRQRSCGEVNRVRKSEDEDCGKKWVNPSELYDKATDRLTNTNSDASRIRIKENSGDPR